MRLGEPNGRAMLIGGAEDRAQECVVLREFVRAIDHRSPHVAVMTVATDHSIETGREYTHAFKRLGVRRISIVDVKTRLDANNAEVIHIIDEADALFFTGGDQ